MPVLNIYEYDPQRDTWLDIKFMHNMYHGDTSVCQWCAAKIKERRPACYKPNSMTFADKSITRYTCGSIIVTSSMDRQRIFGYSRSNTCRLITVDDQDDVI